MDQRNNMIKEAYQVLNVLGVDVTQQVMNQITINKGKIVAVNDPRNQEEIDNLYREIGRHIGRINQLTAENEELKAQIEELKAQMITAKVEEVMDVKAPEIIIDEPEELTYDENDEVLQNLYTKLKQGQMTLEKCKPTLKAKVQKSIELLEKQIAERIEELKNNKALFLKWMNYEIDTDEAIKRFKKNNNMKDVIINRNEFIIWLSSLGYRRAFNEERGL